MKIIGTLNQLHIPREATIHIEKETLTKDENGIKVNCCCYFLPNFPSSVYTDGTPGCYRKAGLFKTFFLSLE